MFYKANWPYALLTWLKDSKTLANKPYAFWSVSMEESPTMYCDTNCEANDRILIVT
jgi:hypothetical protein